MAENTETTEVETKETVAVADKPVTKAEPASPAEKPVNTDVFNTCTRRCTRRTWDFFLSIRDDIEQFKTRLVRGCLTFKSATAAEQALKTLAEQGGITEVITQDKTIEFTGSLAAVQLVLRDPNTTMFDALKID